MEHQSIRLEQMFHLIPWMYVALTGRPQNGEKDCVPKRHVSSLQKAAREGRHSSQVLRNNQDGEGATDLQIFGLKMAKMIVCCSRYQGRFQQDVLV